MLQLVKSQYDIVLADAVFRECRNLGNEYLYSSIKNLPLAVERNDIFISLADIIQSIDYRLGPGEIESIAASILLTQSGIDNYDVIDERLARSVVERIHLNPRKYHRFYSVQSSEDQESNTTSTTKTESSSTSSTSHSSTTSSSTSSSSSNSSTY